MQRDRGYRILAKEKFIKKRIISARNNGNFVYKLQHLNQKNWEVQEVEMICGKHLNELADQKPMTKCSNKNCMACYGDLKEKRKKKIKERHPLEVLR